MNQTWIEYMNSKSDLQNGVLENNVNIYEKQALK
jgi:hypothetical protein